MAEAHAQALFAYRNGSEASSSRGISVKEAQGVNGDESATHPLAPQKQQVCGIVSKNPPKWLSRPVKRALSKAAND